MLYVFQLLGYFVTQLTTGALRLDPTVGLLCPRPPITLLYIVLPCVAAVVSCPAWWMLVLLIARYVSNLINGHFILDSKTYPRLWWHHSCNR